jgi:hypothetical protein
MFRSFYDNHQVFINNEMSLRFITNLHSVKDPLLLPCFVKDVYMGLYCLHILKIIVEY